MTSGDRSVISTAIPLAHAIVPQRKGPALRTPIPGRRNKRLRESMTKKSSKNLRFAVVSYVLILFIFTFVAPYTFFACTITEIVRMITYPPTLGYPKVCEYFSFVDLFVFVFFFLFRLFFLLHPTHLLPHLTRNCSYVYVSSDVSLNLALRCSASRASHRRHYKRLRSQNAYTNRHFESVGGMCIPGGLGKDWESGLIVGSPRVKM